VKRLGALVNKLVVGEWHREVNPVGP
jgi:hypothetical protein